MPLSGLLAKCERPCFRNQLRLGDVFMLPWPVPYSGSVPLMCAPQIADFGMSRDLADETYYISRGGKIPVKWTAPEVKYSLVINFTTLSLFSGSPLQEVLSSQ